ncbi:MAG: iron ABC transporter permease [Aerococcus sp.]|nr:iron ABC transporter permease [Aerococcus sp.]
MKHLKHQKIVDRLLSISIGVAVVIFILIPFLYVFKSSVVVDHHLSLERFTTLLTTRQRLLGNTVKLGIVSTLLQSVTALVVAITLTLATPKWRQILLGIFFVTLISPPFVTSLAYVNLFGRRGWITYGLLHLSLNVYGMWGVAIMQMFSHLSLNVLLLYGFLKNIPSDRIASARNLGAKTTDVIRDLFLPEAWVGLKAVIVLAFFRSVSDFGTPAIIGGKFNVLALESYLAVIAEGDLTKAATMNIVLLIPAFLIFLIYRRSGGEVSLTGWRSDTTEVSLQRNGWTYQLCRTLTVLCVSALVLLYVTIIVSAFTRMQQGHLVVTLQNLIETRPYITGALIRSVIYSLIAATVGSLLGLLIGYYTRIRQLRLMGWIDGMANLPYMIPGTFFGLGYLLAFNHPPLLLTGTAAIVVLNVTFKQLPFSARVGQAAMENLDTQMLASVHSLGGGRWNEIRDVLLPLSADSLKVAFINAFTATMTTVGSIIFLVYPGQKVLTLVMFDVIQSGKYQVGSVIALIIILICLAVNGLFYTLGGRHVSRD